MSRPSARVFWPGQIVGIAVMAIGIRGLLDAPLGRPPSFVRFFVGSALAHDLVLAPAAFGVGWLVKRVVPAWTWPTVRNGLFVSVCLALFSYPFVRGFGIRPANATAVPRNYAEGLLIALAVVWAVTAGLLVHRGWRRQSEDASATTSRISSP